MKKFFFKFSILLSVLSCIGFPTLAMPGEEENMQNEKKRFVSSNKQEEGQEKKQEIPSLVNLCVRKIQSFLTEEERTAEEIYKILDPIPSHIQKKLLHGLSPNDKWNLIKKTKNIWGASKTKDNGTETISEETLEKILEEKLFDDLCFGGLREPEINEDDAQIIAQSPVKKITLRYFLAESFRKFFPAESPQKPLFMHLTHVTLENCNIEDRHILGLVHLSYLQKLTYLKLSETPVGNTGIWLIAMDPTFKNLTQLHICHSNYGKNVIFNLIGESSFLHNLTHLTLAGTGNYSPSSIDDEVAEEIANSTKFGKLEVLDLHSNDIRNAGLIAIAASKNFPNLTTLDVSDNAFGDAGVLAFSKHPDFFPNLKKIIFNESDESLIEDISTYEILRKAFHPRQLEIIESTLPDIRTKEN